ncbi:hypothetical protein BXU11_08140 [Flavobacterium sp. LM5]|uniref:hypothetical protein n=1 Tax=Flavobacterium sp. LM5 TaxID=1938610 RepID=UPI0009946085|nr:hypothetical protein [Flavobacterium sp. LM5]OOV29824.1 hypothetical protein BXU11_08140 [Flavobacterium sp. LM5]
MSTITFEEYKEGIKAQFQAIKRVGIYGSGDLSNVTPAQLRDLCLRKAENQLNPKDEMVFRYFFNAKEGEKLSRAIENYGIGKLKSVISFLKGEKNSENRNRIELAAILVDFNPRPFHSYFSNEGKELKIGEESLQEIKETSNEERIAFVAVSEKEIKSEQNKSILERYKKQLATGAVLCSMGIGLVSLLPKKECMQWNTNHYEVVDCTSKSSGFMDSRIPINNERLGLKKLEPKTIKTYFKNGQPSVWYAKIEGKIELFNQPGLHPTTGKTLKPITQYIINKYLRD